MLDVTLQDYANVQFGALLSPLIKTGIYSLEQNWEGPIIGQKAAVVVPGTYRHFTESVAGAMTPRSRWSWRLQQLFYRANYDMFVYTRVDVERAGEYVLSGLHSTLHAGD